MQKSAFLASGILLLAALSAKAENLTFIGQTDKDALSYQVGETITLTVTLVDADNDCKPVTGRTMRWRLTQDDYGTPLGEKNRAAKASGTTTSNPLVVTTTLTKPGMVRLQVDLQQSDDLTTFSTKKPFFDGGAAAGANDIQEDVAPADFKTFWCNATNELYSKDYTATLTAISLSGADPAIDYYSYVVTPAGSEAGMDRDTTTGLIAMPKNAAAGSQKLFVHFFGYGWEPTPLPTASKVKEGNIVVYVTRYGEEPLREKAYYDDIKTNVHKSAYCFRNNTGATQDTDFYKMLMRDLLSVRYAKSLAQWNGRDLETDGGSMGGYQAIGVASLDRDVTHCNAWIPFGADLAGGAKFGRITGFRPDYNAGVSNNFDHIDLKNLADLCTCPVTIEKIGLGDYTCPPSTALVLYRHLPKPKKVTYYQNMGHGSLNGTGAAVTADMQKFVRMDGLEAANVPGVDFDGGTVSVASPLIEKGMTASFELGGVTYGATCEAGSVAIAVPNEIGAGTHADCALNFYDAAGYLVSTAPLCLCQGHDATVAPTSPAGAWFSETAASMSGGWSKTPATSAGKIVFSTGDEIDFTPAARDDELTVVDCKASFYCGDAEDASANSQTGIRVVPAQDGSLRFACLSNGAWLTNETLPVQVETTYDLRVALDYVHHKVSYSVRPEGVGDYQTIFADLPLAEADQKMTGLSFAGDGALALLQGECGEFDVDTTLCEANGTRYETIADAIAAGKSSVNLTWDASWEPASNVVCAVGGEKTLVIAGGYPSAAQAATVPGATVVRGGKFSDAGYAAWSGMLDPACRFVSLANVSGSVYTREVLAGTQPVAADEKVFVVSGNDIAFSPDDLVARGIVSEAEKGDDAKVSAALAQTGKNGNAAWQNVALGLSNTDASDIPVVQPIQTDNPNALTVALGNVAGNAKTSAKVSYHVNAYASLGGEPVDVSDEVGPSERVEMALPDSGVRYYKIAVNVQ